MMFGITEPTGSHLPILEAAARKTTGLVIEHGAGLYSTPLLARLGCRVLCCESQPGWRDWAAWMYEGRAEVVETITPALARLPEATLVFIDGPSSERAQLIEACFDMRVPTIVAHDTHPRIWQEYGWRKEHFSARGYTVTHDDLQDRYRTTLWQR